MAEYFPGREEESDDDTSDHEKDSSDSKSKKGSRRDSQALGGIVARSEKQPEPRQENAKEEVAEKSKSLINQIIGEKEPLEKTEDSASAETVEVFTPVEAVDTTPAEERAAEALAEGGEIDLSGVSESRDEAIIDMALHRVAEADVAESVDVENVESADAVPAENVEDDAEEDSEESVEEREPTAAEDPQAEAAPDDDEATRPTPTPQPTSGSGSSRGGAGSSGGGSGGSGGSGTPPPTPPVPPVPPIPALPRRQRTVTNTAYFNQPPTTPNVLNVANPNVAPNPASNEEAERDAAYRRGRRKGLVAGLLIGGGVEHIRHRRREKRMERKFERERKAQEKAHDKKLEDNRWEQIRQADATKAREAAAPAPATAIEQARQDTHTEEARAEEQKLAAEKQRIAAEAEQAQRQLEQEQLDIAAGHHIESSAWHNIEVDEHGKAVQEATFEYGHEYYKERDHETGPKDKQQFDEAAGEVALVAAAMSGGSTAGPSVGSDAQASPSSTAAPAVANTNGSSRKSVLRSVTTPPTTTQGTIGWFIVLLVIIGLFILFLF